MDDGGVERQETWSQEASQQNQPPQPGRQQSYGTSLSFI